MTTPGYQSPGERVAETISSLLPTLLPTLLSEAYSVHTPSSTATSTPSETSSTSSEDEPSTPPHHHSQTLGIRPCKADSRILEALSSLKTALNQALVEYDPVLPQDNGSTLLLSLFTHDYLYVTSIGDSSAVLTDHQGRPLRLWRRLGVQEGEGICSWEDTLDAFPSQLREGQTFQPLRRDFLDLRAHISTTREMGQDVHLITSPRSAYALRMTNTVGNLNHSGSLLDRTNLYAIPLSPLSVLPSITLLLVSDGVKDVMSARDIARHTLGPHHALHLPPPENPIWKKYYPPLPSPLPEESQEEEKEKKGKKSAHPSSYASIGRKSVIHRARAALRKLLPQDYTSSPSSSTSGFPSSSIPSSATYPMLSSKGALPPSTLDRWKNTMPAGRWRQLESSFHSLLSQHADQSRGQVVDPRILLDIIAQSLLLESIARGSPDDVSVSCLQIHFSSPAISHLQGAPAQKAASIRPTSTLLPSGLTLPPTGSYPRSKRLSAPILGDDEHERISLQSQTTQAASSKRSSRRISGFWKDLFKAD